MYSDPASENRNRYARAKEEPSRHALRRERRDHADRERHLIHLSDLETSDSTRLSIDRKALQDQLQAATPRATTSRLATVNSQHHAHPADAERLTAQLMAPPSAFTATGARPKQTGAESPATPRVQTSTSAVTEKIHVTTATTDKGHLTGASNSSQDNTSGRSEHRRHRQSSDTQTQESSSLDDEDQSMKILNTIARLKKRARNCMSKEQVQSLSSSLKPLADEAHHAQVTYRDLIVHHARFATMTLSAIQADIEEAEAHAAARRTSTQTELTSSRATDNTQSGNLSQQSNERKEADTLHKFTKLYEKIPRPTETEPIIYVEERREHDEEVLLQLDNHY